MGAPCVSARCCGRRVIACFDVYKQETGFIRRLHSVELASHSHCDSADPLTDGLGVCCGDNRTGRGSKRPLLPPSCSRKAHAPSRPPPEAWRRRLRSLREPKCSSRSPLRPTRSSRTACTPLHANGTSSRARLYAFCVVTPHPCVARRMKVPEAAPFTAILKYAAEEVPAH